MLFVIYLYIIAFAWIKTNKKTCKNLLTSSVKYDTIYLQIRKMRYRRIEMDKINSNEQWKTGGDCTLCRRQNYCTKKCKQHKQKIDREINTLIYERMPDSIKSFLREHSPTSKYK